MDIGKQVGPEHLAFGPDGNLHAAMASGAIQGTGSAMSRGRRGHKTHLGAEGRRRPTNYF
ncbi:hypothetical protein [Ramlibacter montanisoli]|uniref:Uncharacterized protein n=1 Tax=Ramlibacter montanisoli TaxID=2732512 RepID=A0A849KFD6_9BURK|nr:hypothetical protein [Ramlibacter montanisoli]NNU45244.1 hypothetical protein [Ramlibacter montanisoli]